ncbi:MAG: DDE-type integrase/transposase/recombinase [Bacteroidia bacterium]|nr:DDE-type integrase/transposase/recombinase [Bacteroidia bacterium]
MIRTYDFRLKLDAVNGKIPSKFKKIVKSNMVYAWKKENWNKLIGFDYYNKQEKNIRKLNHEIDVLKESVNESLKNLKAENEVLSLAIKIASSGKEYRKLIYENRAQIVDFVESNKKAIGVKRCSELLNINNMTYYEWKTLAKDDCRHSSRLTCIKRSPNQITLEEEFKILQLLQDPRFEHFPISSLVWKAHHENIVHATRTSWRRLQRRYKIVRLKPKKRKRYSSKSLKADYPNQYLHADITYFKLKNGETYYIYLVKDNYSKYIKSWAISDKIAADTRIETFQHSLSDIDPESNIKISFITDSGSENKNNKVKKFFKGFTNVDIKYAKKDIVFSNSMIERYNMDLKYMYLYRENIYTLKALISAVGFAIKEHNYIKRMECINGQTPYELYNGLPSKAEWINEQWKKARKNRCKKAKNTICCKRL